MIFISVDLPAPFSPTRPWISPSRSEKSTARKAVTPPNVLVTPDSSNKAGRLGVGTVGSGTGDQIRKWSSIHIIPGAFALVTTGPSTMTFFGIPPGPVFSPETIAATPAITAPPWIRQDGLRTVANI